MEKYQGVAITDGVNRKNHILPLNAIIKAYRDTWNTVIPMNLGHDRTKPIGYTMLTGVYMEPGKAYVTNESAIMETDEEYFNSFEKMRDVPAVEIKLAIDMDMIGLVGTEHPELEYQYIRGPHFNDDLDCIPEGVTCHENEHYDNVFSNLLGLIWTNRNALYPNGQLEFIN